MKIKLFIRVDSHIGIVEDLMLKKPINYNKLIGRKHCPSPKVDDGPIYLEESTYQQLNTASRQRQFNRVIKSYGKDLMVKRHYHTHP